MNDAFRMREGEPVRHLHRDADSVAGLEGTGLLDALLHRTAGEVLHDNERRIVDFADVVDRDDVRVRKLRERARFLHEHPAEVSIGCGRGVEDLQGNVAVERLIAGEVDLRRAAHSERLLDLVPTL